MEADIPSREAVSDTPEKAESAGKKKQRLTQEQRSARSRKALLKSAIACISDLGCEQATVEVIARNAGLSRGAVQHHFGSRNELLAAVVDEFGSSLSTAHQISPELPLEKRLERAIDLTWKRLKTPHFLAVIHIWLSLKHTPGMRPTVARKVKQIEMDLDAEWQRLFVHDEVAGATVSATRRLVLATLRGLALRKLYFSGAAEWTDEIDTLKKLALMSLRS